MIPGKLPSTLAPEVPTSGANYSLYQDITSAMPEASS